MNKLNLLVVAAAIPVASAFAPVAPASALVVASKPAFVPSALFAEDGKASDAVFLADEGEPDEDVSFAKAESLGRGAAKVSYLFVRTYRKRIEKDIRGYLWYLSRCLLILIYKQ